MPNETKPLSLRAQMAIRKGDFPPFSPYAAAGSGRQGQPLAHPHQVVSSEASSVWSCASARWSFPGKHLFDPLAHPEADGVAGLGRDSIGHGCPGAR